MSSQSEFSKQLEANFHIFKHSTRQPRNMKFTTIVCTLLSVVTAKTEASADKHANVVMNGVVHKLSENDKSIINKSIVSAYKDVSAALHLLPEVGKGESDVLGLLLTGEEKALNHLPSCRWCGNDDVLEHLPSCRVSHPPFFMLSSHYFPIFSLAITP